MDYSGAIKGLERANKKFEFLVKWASTHRGGRDDLLLLPNGRTGEVVWPPGVALTDHKIDQFSLQTEAGHKSRGGAGVVGIGEDQ
jgi:hypothetical protein